MRAVLPLLICLAAAPLAAAPSVAAAADRPAAECLSPGDTHEAVLAHRAVAPSDAIGRARRAVPDGEVLRAALCRDANSLVYRVTVLEPGGRIVRVTLDAPSGKVETLR